MNGAGDSHLWRFFLLVSAQKGNDSGKGHLGHDDGWEFWLLDCR